MWLPYRQPVYHCQPVYHSENSLDPQQVHAILEHINRSEQHGQGVVVAPPHVYGQSQVVTPPPPPPPNTPSSSTGPVCGPGWAAPSAVPAPSPNVEHSQHGSAPSTQIHLAEKQLQEQEQSLKEQFIASQNRQAYSEAEIQEWHALSSEAKAKLQQREYAAWRLREATRRKAEANNF